MYGFQSCATTDIYFSVFAWTSDWEAADKRNDKSHYNMQTVKESGVAQALFQIDYNDEVAFPAKRWLFNVAHDKIRSYYTPFTLVASFIHLHDPYVTRPEWWKLYRNEDIDMPT